MRRSKASPELFDDFDSMLIKELLKCWLILSDFSNVIFYFWQLSENNNYHNGNGSKISMLRFTNLNYPICIFSRVYLETVQVKF